MSEVNIKTVDGFPRVMPRPESVPELLREMPWAVWIAEPRHGQPGKFNKAPRCPRTGVRIGADKPELFGTFEDACKALESGNYSGFGVLLTGGVVGVDIDGYAQAFEAHPALRGWLERVKTAGAYCEQSPSGAGLRVFMRGKLPGRGRKSGHLEIYDNVRFLTVTGRKLKGAGDGYAGVC